jgi:hypothetical protein
MNDEMFNALQKITDRKWHGLQKLAEQSSEK